MFLQHLVDLNGFKGPALQICPKDNGLWNWYLPPTSLPPQNETRWNNPVLFKQCRVWEYLPAYLALRPVLPYSTTVPYSVGFRGDVTNRPTMRFLIPRTPHPIRSLLYQRGAMIQQHLDDSRVACRGIWWFIPSLKGTSPPEKGTISKGPRIVWNNHHFSGGYLSFLGEG